MSIMTSTDYREAELLTNVISRYIVLVGLSQMKFYNNFENQQGYGTRRERPRMVRVTPLQ